MSLPCPIKDLIPQKGKMGLDETLIKADKNDGEGSALIQQGNIFLDDDGQLSNIVLIEYVNQLVAAIQGYNEKYHNKKAMKGLFVGIQEAEFYKPVRLGDLLSLKGRAAEEISQVTFIEGVIESGGDKIARLTTKLYEVRDSKEFDDLMSAGQNTGRKKSVLKNDKKPPDYLTSGMHRKLYSYLQDIETGDGFISFKISCPEDFDAFDGHFPGNPLLPGIILLEIGCLGLELFLNKKAVIKYIKKMKIAGVVLPGQPVACSISIDKSAASQISFSAAFKDSNGREFSRYSGYCREGQ